MIEKVEFDDCWCAHITWTDECCLTEVEKAIIETVMRCVYEYDGIPMCSPAMLEWESDRFLDYLDDNIGGNNWLKDEDWPKIMDVLTREKVGYVQNFGNDEIRFMTLEARCPTCQCGETHIIRDEETQCEFFGVEEWDYMERQCVSCGYKWTPKKLDEESMKHDIMMESYLDSELAGIEEEVGVDYSELDTAQDNG
jgi:predicted nucleic-acid-binding Zn-ribbon protein